MANNIIIKLKRLNRRRESERGENTSDGSINKNHDSNDKPKQNKKGKLRDKIVLKVFRINYTKDKSHYYDEFEIPLQKSTTVLP